MEITVNPETGRLSVGVVIHLNRLFEGDARTERQIEIFIGDRFQAKNFFYVPAAAAVQMIRRPADFLAAVKRHCEPQLL